MPETEQPQPAAPPRDPLDEMNLVNAGYVADLYERIGTSSRAAAALFAMEHGLVGPSGSDEPG